MTQENMVNSECKVVHVGRLDRGREDSQTARIIGAYCTYCTDLLAAVTSRDSKR